mgnify:CR=1 FL=1
MKGPNSRGVAMPEAAPPPPDRKLAVLCVLGILACILMTFVELSRALAGDSTRAWAYVLEWPLFGVFIAWIWRRLERRHAQEYLQRRTEEDQE